MSHSRIRVLFIAESATLAHIVRPLKLASTLSQDLFEIHFAADLYFEFVFKDLPFQFHKIKSRSPEEFQQVLEAKGILFDAGLIQDYVDEELLLIEKLQPDILIGDLRPSLTVSAAKLETPYVLLSNAYWSPFVSEKGLPVLYSDRAHSLRNFPVLAQQALREDQNEFDKILPFVFEAQAAGLDQVRVKYGLDKFSDYLTGFTSADLVLFSDLPSLVHTTNLPSNCRFIGSVSWAPNVSLPLWWSEISTKKDLVYLSLGSSGPRSLIPAIISALETLNLPVVFCSAGAEVPKNLPGNFYCADYLPGDQVLKYASLAITNGGSPSSYQAFEAGVPVLGIPQNMDQLLCMKHAIRSGACEFIRSDMLTSSNVMSLVRSMLTKRSYRDNALKLKNEFQTFNATEILTDSLLTLANRNFASTVNF